MPVSMTINDPARYTIILRSGLAGFFSEAVKSLKVSLNLLNSSATLSTETKVGFGKILIQSIKKLQKKDDNESPVGSVKQNFISIKNENPSSPGVSSKVKMSLCIFRYSVHLRTTKAHEGVM